MTPWGAGRTTRPSALVRRIALVQTVLLTAASGVPAQSLACTFVETVESFTPGSSAGHGQDRMPGIVLGPPRGGGPTEGALDVLSLGSDGEVVLGFGAAEICDAPGIDFVVFENAFAAGDPTGAVFVEVGIVAVSSDGINYTTFPYDAETLSGLAGRTSVLSHPDNGIDACDPAVSGGDGFDLAAVGLDRVRFVRITDPGASIADPGNRVPPGVSGGFDLDAVAVLHPCNAVAGTPTPTATATATADITLPTPTPTLVVATPTVPPTPSHAPGDADGDGEVTPDDANRAVLEIFDGDGDAATASGGGSIVSFPGVDANQDGSITASDLVAILRRIAGGASCRGRCE